MEVFNDLASIEVMAAVGPSVRPGQVIMYHDWENFMFKGRRHYKALMSSAWKPLDIAGGYGHLRPRSAQYHSQIGSSDRGTRVEVRKVKS